MSIELVSENQGDTIEVILSSAKNEIKIISPFISLRKCEYLEKLIIGNNIKCKIITRFNSIDFLNNVNTLSGLKNLVKNNAIILALKNIHTKLYISDDTLLYIGSANFTEGGFKNNFELGIKIDSYERIFNESLDYFDRIWENILEYNINNDDCSLITSDKIECEINKVDNYKNNNIIEKYSNYDSIDFGANIKTIITNEDKANENDDIYYIENYIGGIKIIAKLLFENNIYKILKGSMARIDTVPSFRYHPKRNSLISNNSLVDRKNYYEFKEDTILSSPSTAASIVLGSSVSGYTSWRNKNGKGNYINKKDTAHNK